MYPSTPSSPSYARPTLSSIYRESARAQRPIPVYPNTLDSERRTLRTPPSRSGHNHQLAFQQANRDRSLTIKSADPSKPCPFASLPTEIRQTIYSYVLRGTLYPLHINHLKRYFAHFWPALLRVSRRVRDEAAYLFYSHSRFEFRAWDVDLRPLANWVEKLPVAHRLFLTRNRNLSIMLQIRGNYYIESDHDLWLQCQHYGNVYNKTDFRHRRHFISFCRLTNWWLWCSKPIHRDIPWKYEFVLGTDSCFTTTHYWLRENNTERGMMLQILKDDVGAFALPCVRDDMVNARMRGSMREAAIKMLVDLDDNFREVWAVDNEEAGWDARMKTLKQNVEKW